MSRLVLLVVASLLAASIAVAQTPSRPRAYWVKENTSELSAPNGASVGSLAKDQQVAVYELRDGFARLTPNGAPERWVAHRELTQQKPPNAPAGSAPPPPAAAEPAPLPGRPAGRAPPGPGGGRILGLPRVGEEGTTATDVDVLQRAARQFIDQGRCSQIDYGDRSASRPGAYVISCDGRNIVFMPSDLK